MKTKLGLIGLMLLCGTATTTIDAAALMQSVSYLKTKCPDGGAVVWQYGGSGYNTESDIYLQDISGGSAEKLEKGCQPEFSPDGSKLAWISGTTAKGRMVRGTDKTVRVIATGVSKNAGVHWVSNSEVVVVKSDAWKKVALSGVETAVPDLDKLGKGGTEVDVKLCSDGVWAYVTGTTWKTSDGKSGSINGACSPSFSPDGKSVTGLQSGHNVCKLTAIRTGGISGSISLSEADCGDKGIDNQRWSSNDDRFIVCQYECKNRLVVIERGTNTMIDIGACTSESYGDFAKAIGSGTPWPSQATSAKAITDQSNIAFSWVIGETTPASKTVAVYTATDTLKGVQVGTVPSWLTVNPSATSGKSISVTMTVKTAGLTARTYTANVPVTTSNAGSVTFAVTLTVSATPAGPVLRVTAPNGGEKYTVGQTIAIKWEAIKDSFPQGVDVRVSQDNGKSWTTINDASVKTTDAEWGNFSWIIPAKLTTESGTSVPAASTSCFINIRDYSDTGLEDASDGAFTIIGTSTIVYRGNRPSNSRAGLSEYFSLKGERLSPNVLSHRPNAGSGVYIIRSTNGFVLQSRTVLPR